MLYNIFFEVSYKKQLSNFAHMRVPTKDILSELADFALESDSKGIKYEYTDEDFLNALIIFNSAAGSRLFDLNIEEKVTKDVAYKMAEKFGEEFRLLIYTFLNIDTLDLVKK